MYVCTHVAKNCTCSTCTSKRDISIFLSNSMRVYIYFYIFIYLFNVFIDVSAFLDVHVLPEMFDMPQQEEARSHKYRK